MIVSVTIERDFPLIVNLGTQVSINFLIRKLNIRIKIVSFITTNCLKVFIYI